MAMTGAQRQANYRRRSDRDNLVRLQSVVSLDVDTAIRTLANKLGVPMYAVLEHAVKRLAKERLGADRIGSA